MTTFCAKHTAREAKCFINTWAVFQPFKVSIPLSAKMTTMTTDTLVDMDHVLHVAAASTPFAGSHEVINQVLLEVTLGAVLVIYITHV